MTQEEKREFTSLDLEDSVLAQGDTSVTITFERAAEVVEKLRQIDEDAAVELFSYYDDLFKLSCRNDDGKTIADFARMCGYGIAYAIEAQ